jgi:hypothetical protein
MAATLATSNMPSGTETGRLHIDEKALIAVLDV